MNRVARSRGKKLTTAAHQREKEPAKTVVVAADAMMSFSLKLLYRISPPASDYAKAEGAVYRSLSLSLSLVRAKSILASRISDTRNSARAADFTFRNETFLQRVFLYTRIFFFFFF